MGLVRALRRIALAGSVIAIALEARAQTVSITGLPPYGTLGTLVGTVAGVDFSTHRVATYIYIEGSGWWTKPTLASPTVAIGGDGAFAVDIGTGGPSSLDGRAVLFCAGIVPAAVVPETASGAVRIPASFAPLAMECEQRYGRTLWFSGLEWGVKESPLPVGPGENVFTDRLEDVFVDSEGRLHLRVAHHEGQWWSSEVVLLHPHGHGTYLFQTSSLLDRLDPNVTFGTFTWDPWGDDDSLPAAPNREIDSEDSRWTDAPLPTSSQAVVQPADATPQNLHRYTIPDQSVDARLTRFFVWEPDHVRFVALRGHHWPTAFTPADLIDEHVFTHAPAQGRFVPTAGRATLRISLWLNDVAMGGMPPTSPAGGQAVEVIVDRIALPEPDAWLLRGAAGAFLVLLAWWRRR